MQEQKMLIRDLASRFEKSLRDVSQFWAIMGDNSRKTNRDLKKLLLKAIDSIKSFSKLWSRYSNFFENNPEALLICSKFQIDILNNNSLCEKYFIKSKKIEKKLNKDTLKLENINLKTKLGNFGMPVAILEISKNGTFIIKKLNAEFGKIFGLGSQSLRGSCFDSLMPEGLKEMYYREFLAERSGDELAGTISMVLKDRFKRIGLYSCKFYKIQTNIPILVVIQLKRQKKFFPRYYFLSDLKGNLLEHSFAELELSANNISLPTHVRDLVNYF